VIKTTFGQQATTVQYSIKIPGLQTVPGGKIPLAAVSSDWHLAAYSCNDQRQLPKVRLSLILALLIAGLSPSGS
jgi:hypothetical protein